MTICTTGVTVDNHALTGVFIAGSKLVYAPVETEHKLKRIVVILCYVAYWSVLLPQGARTVLRNTEAVSGILQEWRSIDFDSLSSQASYGQPVTQTQSDTFKECKSQL